MFPNKLFLLLLLFSEKLAEDERIDLTIENNEKFEIINKDEEVDDSNGK